MAKKRTRGEKGPDDSNRREFLGRIGGATAATIAAGTIASAQTTTTTPDCDTTVAVTGACATAVDKMAAEGRKVHLIGRVNNGKVIFDQASLEEFTRLYPAADMAFVAVNAPFDPVPYTCNP